MDHWKPSEIIIHESVRDDPVTAFFLKQCPGISTKYVTTGIPKKIVEASDVLSKAQGSLLSKILLEKQVVYIGPASDAVDRFSIPDDRMVCPHFERLKLASNEVAESKSNYA